MVPVFLLKTKKKNFSHDIPFILYRWAQEFLNEENQGLDVLVDFLAYAQSDAPYVYSVITNISHKHYYCHLLSLQ